MTSSLHQATQDIQRRIRELAYVMWESAGRHQGMALDYWLAAEKEVMATFQAATQMMLPEKAATRSTESKTRAPKAVAAVEEAAPAAPAPSKPATRRASSRSKTTAA